MKTERIKEKRQARRQKLKVKFLTNVCVKSNFFFKLKKLSVLSEIKSSKIRFIKRFW